MNQIGHFDNTILSDQGRLQRFRYILLSGVGATFEPKAGHVIKIAEGYCSVIGCTVLDPNGGGAIIYYVEASFDPSYIPPV